jgi:signal transduction histidine kinase/CheY-like chemotaxis protein/AraC-like DNA-binding protein/ABC-type sugar transport system substrate-binding protein
MKRYTLGFVTSWQIYEGTTIDPYAHAIIQGLRAGAIEHGCNLLIACGVGPLAGGAIGRSAWPVPGPGRDFVPVGPWNVDGLIVSPQRLAKDQIHYIQDLIADGFPVVFSTTDLPGPAVAQDNFNGIRQNIYHLIRHGHRRIAFIAGADYTRGDYAERMAAYTETLREAGLDYDPRLVAYGDCSSGGGHIAMCEILDSGAPFTAVVTNNDRSALGAIRALQQANLRVPEDIAVMGYDNILESKAHSPAISTVHNSAFTIGYLLVGYLLERIKGGDKNLPLVRVPNFLVIRQSCGCVPGQEFLSQEEFPDDNEGFQAGLAQVIASATLVETQHMTQYQVEDMCRELMTTFIQSLAKSDFTTFEQTMSHLLIRLDEFDEDALAWHNAIVELQKRLNLLLKKFSNDSASIPSICAILDRVRLQFIEYSRHQTALKLFKTMDMSDSMSLLTAQLQSIQNENEIASILQEHLGQIQLTRIAIFLLENDGLDPVGCSRLLLQVEAEPESGDLKFPTRHFPPPNFYHNSDPFQLAILPLVVDDQSIGYVAFDATNLEPCGSMVINLASALRNLGLYRQAVEGRRLAEEANQLKSHFLSMVSHELRTPLNLIVGLSEMLTRQKEHSRFPTDNLWQDLERIYNNAQHLGWLISDVLDLASSEAGQLRLLHEPLELSEVLKVVAATGEKLACEKNLGWESHLPVNGPWVMGDHTRLRQVVLNFIANAVKYTRVGKITMDVTTQDNQVVVAISDTGLGIPLDEQSKIFDEFRRSNISIKRGYSGMGLGLAISKQLIQLHHGTIGVYSTGKEGDGSTFFFTLPTIRPPNLTDQAEDESSPAHLTIAGLTDQANTFDPLAAQLAERGILIHVYKVEQTPGWLPKLLVSKFAAVILDEQLAAWQGWEIFRALKRHATTEDLPVMVYSHDPVQNRSALVELDYLQKPLSPNQLSELLYQRGLMQLEERKQRTILVVDDEPDSLDWITRLIQQQVMNCRVLPAHNGLEALALIQDTLPDLVLLDLIMPEMDGFSVLEAMRNDKRTSDIPVIILTGKSLTEDDMARLNRHVSKILGKGLFTPLETVSHIETALLKNRMLGPAAKHLVRKAMAYIHLNFHDPITRDQIASYVGINADYLTVCFNQELGISPMTYLSRYRISRAKALLEDQEKKITEVAMEVGFSDSAHFSRTFQKETGISPRDYQRGLRSKE